MKKRLLFVCHNAQFNGAEYSLYRLICVLKDDWEISVLAPSGGEFEKHIRTLSLKFYSFTPCFPFRLKHSDKGALAAFLVQWVKNTKELIQSIPKPDLIHSNTFFVWEGASLAQHFNCPHVWNLREIVGASPTWSAAMGLELQLQTMHQLCDHFICVSKALKQSLPEPLQTKTHVVHNGLDPVSLLSRKQAREWLEETYGFDAQTKILLSVGNFIPDKDHRFLLPIAKRILQKYQSIKFLWIGRHDFSYKSIRAEIETMGLGASILCPGQIDDIGKYMSGADLYLLPSQTEAFPTVLLEARIAKLPFIARDCGGAQEIAATGGGICTPLNDAALFESEVIKTLNDPMRFKNIDEHAFSMQTMKIGYEAVYQDLLRQPPAPEIYHSRKVCIEQLFALEPDLQYSCQTEKRLERLLRLRGWHRLIKWLLKK